MNLKYYSDLVNRIFKVLCLYESDSPTYRSYVDTLCFELSGNTDFAQTEQIRFKLMALIINDQSHKEVRKTVFECISLINKILSNTEE